MLPSREDKRTVVRDVLTSLQVSLCALSGEWRRLGREVRTEVDPAAVREFSEIESPVRCTRRLSHPLISLANLPAASAGRFSVVQLGCGMIPAVVV